MIFNIYYIEDKNFNMKINNYFHIDFNFIKDNIATNNYKNNIDIEILKKLENIFKYDIYYYNLIIKKT